MVEVDRDIAAALLKHDGVETAYVRGRRRNRRLGCNPEPEIDIAAGGEREEIRLLVVRIGLGIGDAPVAHALDGDAVERGEGDERSAGDADDPAVSVDDDAAAAVPGDSSAGSLEGRGVINRPVQDCAEIPQIEGALHDLHRG